MKLSVSMDTLFRPRDTESFLKGMETVKRAGYDAIEFLRWWDVDLKAVAAKKEELGLEVAAILTNCGCMGDAAAREPFLEDLKKSIEAAHILGCPNLIGQTGLTKMFLSEQTFWDNMIESFRQGGELLKDTDVTLIIEPVNTKVDHAGAFMDTSKDSFFLMRILNNPHVKILYDLYHMQITDGNLLETIQHNISRIGHFHAAGVPGRHEPEFSELNLPYIVREIEKLDYDGYLGMEYRPTMDPYESLVRTRELIS